MASCNWVKKSVDWVMVDIMKFDEKTTRVVKQQQPKYHIPTNNELTICWHMAKRHELGWCKMLTCDHMNWLSNGLGGLID